MARAAKIRASKQPYLSPGQMILPGFESPFDQHLLPDNRWVRLAKAIPWDQLVGVYDRRMHNGLTGASGINSRVVIGSLMIKHLCNLSDEETILQIRENVYMQYFIGYSSFSTEAPFDASLFVEIRKRLGIDELDAINEHIHRVHVQQQEMLATAESSQDGPSDGSPLDSSGESGDGRETHKGKLLVDATACPQEIAYPTDLRLLNDAREKSEYLIDLLYNGDKITAEDKPRTYREKARRDYLRTAQKKNRSRVEIRSAVRKQLQYLKRNIGHIHSLLNGYESIPLKRNSYKYLLVIQELYRQQREMYQTRSHSIDHRIVSIHQPHVRPIVRGKEKAKVEFGAKINVSLVDGFTFLDQFSWDAYNEGTLLIDSVHQYKRRRGYWPKQVLADRIYCSRDNRNQLKKLGIELRAKPLGRPPAVKTEHVRPGERNPIEGKFGQAKNKYGLEKIRARLTDTSQSWIASIILVLNLVKLAGQVPLAIICQIIQTIGAFLRPKELYFFSRP